MITETGTSFYVFGHNDGFWESHDSGQSASFVAQAVQTLLYNSVPPPSAWSYWVISDLWEEGFSDRGTSSRITASWERRCAKTTSLSPFTTR